MQTSTRKEEIIKVASKLFKERGYSAVSMRDIAQSLGIRAASLYNHIESKQEILSVLIMDLACNFTSEMNAIKHTDLSPLQKIQKLIELHIDITVYASEALAALNNDWMHLEGTDYTNFGEMRDDYEEDFRTIIKEGINIGEIGPRHPEVILFSILSTLRTLYIWHEKRGKLDVNVLKKEMVAVLIKGIV